MAQTTMVNFRMDTEAKKDVIERRIPFEISADADPNYSECNIRYLERILADTEAGKAHFEKHELIED